MTRPPQQLIRMHRRSLVHVLVLALHDGSFGLREREVAELSVAGFCPAHDSRPIVDVVAGMRATDAVTVH